MKRQLKYLVIFLLTIIMVYVASETTFYISKLTIMTLFITGIIICLKRIYKSEEQKNKNSNIIATITHDLKTPAVAQIRALELLLKGHFGEITESQRSFIKDILGSCNTTLDMLMNMLWLYKFDNKMISLNTNNFCVKELLKEILNENKLLFSSNKYTFEEKYKSNNLYITADRMHIKRIISNLLTNAVNHSITNTTIVIESYIENNTFVFKVINQGKNIHNEMIKCIFDRNKVFCQKCEGLSTGLGLYLSNSLVTLNGGEMICKSEENGITTFGFSLKIIKKEQQQHYRNFSLPLLRR